jgi:hypothetical protein
MGMRNAGLGKTGICARRSVWVSAATASRLGHFTHPRNSANSLVIHYTKNDCKIESDEVRAFIQSHSFR